MAGSTAHRPRKIPQPHGGALYGGGVPGNRGGGRSRSAATHRAGECLDAVLSRIGQVLWEEPIRCPHCGETLLVPRGPSIPELTRIIDALAKVVFDRGGDPPVLTVAAHPGQAGQDRTCPSTATAQGRE